MKLETVKLFHCFPKQEDLPLSQQSYLLVFSLLNNDCWSNPSSTHADTRIWTLTAFLLDSLASYCDTFTPYLHSWPVSVFLLAPHCPKCKVLLVRGYRHLLNDNHSIQFPVLSLTGILISTCISVINTLGVYWQYRQWKVPESNRPHGLLVHLTVIAYQRYTFPCAFSRSTSEVKRDIFYICRASASHLLVGSYPTTWGREELNLQCLPLGNWFTVRRNTANRCRLPITATRRLTICFTCYALHDHAPCDRHMIKYHRTVSHRP